MATPRGCGDDCTYVDNVGMAVVIVDNCGKGNGCVAVVVWLVVVAAACCSNDCVP